MNIVLLSGGSGKRLWPLSSETRSKQFLKLLKNSSGEYESMLQRVYGQLKSCGLSDNVVIATGAGQVDSIRSQLGNSVDIAVEPMRRDTFPAIALACAYLAYEKKVPVDEVVAVIPVDPYAEDAYFETVNKAGRAVENNAAKLVLMGVVPSYPSAKYGYIMAKERAEGEVFDVGSFQEKPSEERASELIADGGIWNCGVFVFRLSYMMDIVAKYLPDSDYRGIAEKYEQLPRTSFDYEIVEKERSIAAVKYDGIWKDLGTWNTLTEEMDASILGRAIVGEGTENTHIINELSVPVVTLGAKDMVVVASPDGILISDKQKSSYLKPYADSINQRPMYEERRWGTYKVLDYEAYSDGSKALTKNLFIEKGKQISYQKHFVRDEIWTVVDGTGELLLDGHVRNVRRGDLVYILKGQWHAMRAVTDLRFIEVQIGTELTEEDIERREYDW